jgi:hypothetical protein
MRSAIQNGQRVVGAKDMSKPLVSHDLWVVIAPLPPGALEADADGAVRFELSDP